MSRFKVDFSEVRRLAADIGSIAGNATDEGGKVVEKGALNIKRDAQDLIRGQMSGAGKTYIPHYPNAIGYDIRAGLGGVEAEIGPDSGMPQGGMGPPLEEGGARHGPMPHMVPALDNEEPRFVKALGDMTISLIERAL